MDKFFQHNTFVIDENIGTFKLSNSYRVYNSQGEEIGAIQEHKSFWHILLGFFMSNSMLPFELRLLTDDGRNIACLKRGMTFFMSRVRIFDENNDFIGSFQQKFTLMKSKFTLSDNLGHLMATIQGDWKAWIFTITDANGQQIGVVNKKWAGMAKELFTTADKYIVNISPALQDEKTRMAITTVAAAIDMILKEN